MDAVVARVNQKKKKLEMDDCTIALFRFQLCQLEVRMIQGSQAEQGPVLSYGPDLLDAFSCVDNSNSNTLEMD